MNQIFGRWGLYRAWAVTLAACSLLLWAPVGLSDEGAAKKHPFHFRDVGDEAGIFPPLTAIHGHAAAWGDVDGDGWIDLFVGMFNSGKQVGSNMLLRNVGGKFRLDGQEVFRGSGDASGSVFADLDNDGDLDFYLSNYRGRSYLLRNEGTGKFADVSGPSGACPDLFAGRSVTVLDTDGDGLLDLLVGEHPQPARKQSRLFRNMGHLKFADVTQAAGLGGIPGLGVAAGDVNNDTRPDIFLAANQGGNRLFLNDGQGKFREAHGTQKIFSAGWPPPATADDMICGVCMSDVNRDGRLDILIGQHYKRPWIQPVAVRLYLNRGLSGGNPIFEDVTVAAGLSPLAMKAPHVEIQDFDNDGWPDIYVSIVKFAEGQPYPVIFKHLGVRDGLPRFREDAWALNDFPVAQDKAAAGTGKFYDKMLADKKIMYFAPGPSGDYDNDGRLDLFLPNWWTNSRSLLLRNETPGGNWLAVQFSGAGKGADPALKPRLNPMGIGAKVQIFSAGKAGDALALLGCQDLSAGYGYASGQAAKAHFGLGKETACDVLITLPHGQGKIEKKAVKANQILQVGT